MALVICMAGHRAGLKCTHKRGLDHDTVSCAIEATPEICNQAQPAKDYIQGKLNLTKVKKEDLA